MQAPKAAGNRSAAGSLLANQFATVLAKQTLKGKRTAAKRKGRHDIVGYERMRRQVREMKEAVGGVYSRQELREAARAAGMDTSSESEGGTPPRGPRLSGRRQSDEESSRGRSLSPRGSQGGGDRGASKERLPYRGPAAAASSNRLSPPSGRAASSSSSKERSASKDSLMEGSISKDRRGSRDPTGRPEVDYADLSELVEKGKGKVSQLLKDLHIDERAETLADLASTFCNVEPRAQRIEEELSKLEAQHEKRQEFATRKTEVVGAELHKSCLEPWEEREMATLQDLQQFYVEIRSRASRAQEPDARKKCRAPADESVDLEDMEWEAQELQHRLHELKEQEADPAIQESELHLEELSNTVATKREVFNELNLDVQDMSGKTGSLQRMIQFVKIYCSKWEDNLQELSETERRTLLAMKQDIMDKLVADGSEAHKAAEEALENTSRDTVAAQTLQQEGLNFQEEAQVLERSLLSGEQPGLEALTTPLRLGIDTAELHRSVQHLRADLQDLTATTMAANSATEAMEKCVGDIQRQLDPIVVDLLREHEAIGAAPPGTYWPSTPSLPRGEVRHRIWETWQEAWHAQGRCPSKVLAKLDTSAGIADAKSSEVEELLRKCNDLEAHRERFHEMFQLRRASHQAPRLSTVRPFSTSSFLDLAADKGMRMQNLLDEGALLASQVTDEARAQGLLGCATA